MLRDLKYRCKFYKILRWGRKLQYLGEMIYVKYDYSILYRYQVSLFNYWKGMSTATRKTCRQAATNTKSANYLLLLLSKFPKNNMIQTCACVLDTHGDKPGPTFTEREASTLDCSTACRLSTPLCAIPCCWKAHAWCAVQCCDPEPLFPRVLSHPPSFHPMVCPRLRWNKKIKRVGV